MHANLVLRDFQTCGFGVLEPSCIGVVPNSVGEHLGDIVSVKAVWLTLTSAFFTFRLGDEQV